MNNGGKSGPYDGMRFTLKGEAVVLAPNFLTFSKVLESFPYILVSPTPITARVP